MSSEELWEAYSTRNPSFDGDGNVTMSAAGLRKLFSQTWSIAYDSGYRSGRKDGERQERPSVEPPGFFKDFFGI
jgi:hypothetical protein